jgi:hypothetical protein
MVLRELWIEGHAEQARLVGAEHAVEGERIFERALRHVHDQHAADPLGHEQPPVGREFHRPWHAVDSGQNGVDAEANAVTGDEGVIAGRWRVLGACLRRDRLRHEHEREHPSGSATRHVWHHATKLFDADSRQSSAGEFSRTSLSWPSVIT